MSAPEEPEDEQWFDEQAGPLVRPYVMTGGRILPIRGRFDLISLIVATRPVTVGDLGFGPEHLAIAGLAAEPVSVAEIAGRLDLPVGTVRVLLGDLLDRGFIAVQEPEEETNMSDENMYEAVLDGLRAL